MGPKRKCVKKETAESDGKLEGTDGNPPPANKKLKTLPAWMHKMNHSIYQACISDDQPHPCKTTCEFFEGGLKINEGVQWLKELYKKHDAEKHFMNVDEGSSEVTS